MLKINLVDKEKKLKSGLEIIILDDLNNTKDKKVLKTLNFEAKDECCELLLQSSKIYVGCEANDYDSIAIAVATAIKKFSSTTLKSAKIHLKDTKNLKAVVEGALLADYKFTNYKSEQKKIKKQEFNIVVDEINKKLEDTLNESIIISEAVNKVRDMVNTTPGDFYPEIMAETAKDIAMETELECKILDEKYLEENSMNAMFSVGIASVHESKLIHLAHKPKNAKKKIVLVGKGLTYDSGGLSLKPADFMTTMKSDKSGGCAVLGIAYAVAKLNLPIELHAIVGAVENMIGGNAYKPDDVLTAKNGKTIEVKNTDAEGRLVLADCLCYAQDEIESIDYIFDYATLTGACVVGVGEYTTGIMGNNQKLKQEAVKHALASGEYATSLDFNRFLRKTIKSDVADINNIASTRYGGAITAGIFLDNFIKEENKDKWIHFDIAGPAYVEKAWGYNPFGASGAGVRMTLEFFKNLK